VKYVADASCFYSANYTINCITLGGVYADSSESPTSTAAIGCPRLSLDVTVPVCNSDGTLPNAQMTLGFTPALVFETTGQILWLGPRLSTGWQSFSVSLRGQTLARLTHTFSVSPGETISAGVVVSLLLPDRVTVCTLRRNYGDVT